jgi:hypothetical protein
MCFCSTCHRTEDNYWQSLHLSLSSLEILVRWPNINWTKIWNGLTAWTKVVFCTWEWLAFHCTYNYSDRDIKWGISTLLNEYQNPTHVYPTVVYNAVIETGLSKSRSGSWESGSGLGERGLELGSMQSESPYSRQLVLPNSKQSTLSKSSLPEVPRWAVYDSKSKDQIFGLGPTGNELDPNAHLTPHNTAASWKFNVGLRIILVWQVILVSHVWLIVVSQL